MIFALFLIVSVIYAIGIFTLSSLSKPPGAEEGEQVIPLFDKIAHTILYIGFAFFVFHTIEWFPGGFRYNRILATFLIVTLYGVSDEVHQLFVPGRFFSLLDIFFDALGAFILLLAAHYWPSDKINFPFLRKTDR